MPDGAELPAVAARFTFALGARHDGNISAAAKAAGIDRKTFHRLVNEYQIHS